MWQLEPAEVEGSSADFLFFVGFFFGPADSLAGVAGGSLLSTFLPSHVRKC
jgi:hypothetical protein